MDALAGAEPEGALHTVPFILICFVWLSLYVTVIYFSKVPSAEALYPIFIFDVAPGAIGS